MLDSRMIAPVFISCLSAFAYSGEIHVPGDAPTLQAAVDRSIQGDVIVVADGIWTGVGNRDVLLPAWDVVVRSLNGPENCIIDSQGTPVDPHRAFNIVAGQTRATRIEGFTITGGDTLVGAIQDQFNAGGILISNASPTISECLFVDNNCACWGGAICASDSGSPLIERCTFLGNSAGDEGGALFNWGQGVLVLDTCVIMNNTAGTVGGGIHVFGALEATNLTMIGNTAAYNGAMYLGGSSSVVRNSIIWNNNSTALTTGDVGGWNHTVEYSLVEGGHAGVGNIDMDPGFNAFASDGVHLMYSSPCVNAGEPNFVPDFLARDIDGNRRRTLGRIDMGADEFMFRTIQLP